MTSVRPTFVILQISEYFGVAEAAINAATGRLTSLNEVFIDNAAEIQDNLASLVALQKDLAQRVNVEGVKPVTPVDLLELRLSSVQLAVAATAIEVRVAGGAGYVKSSSTSRRFRVEMGACTGP